MLFIVIHHFIVHAVFPDSLDVTTPLTAANMNATIVNGFLFIAVNCFVLISGYYGIHLKVKSLLNLYFTCALYGFLFYLFHLYVDNAHVGRSLIYNSLLIFSHSSWWFINAYLILMIFSPLLNRAIENMNKRLHRIVILLFLLMQVYFGNFWQEEIFDTTGYHAFNFVLLYLIGQYVHRYVSDETIRKNRWLNLGGYGVCAICWAGLTLFDHIHPMVHWEGWTYNNIFMLGGALCFFCFMMSFHFQSRVINWLAVSALAVYLIQDNCYSGKIIYGLAGKYSTLFGTSLLDKWVYIFVISVLFFFAVLLLDKVRYYACQWLYARPWMKRAFEEVDNVLKL